MSKSQKKNPKITGKSWEWGSIMPHGGHIRCKKGIQLEPFIDNSWKIWVQIG
jgi:hypothetical protein